MKCTRPLSSCPWQVPSSECCRPCLQDALERRGRQYQRISCAAAATAGAAGPLLMRGLDDDLFDKRNDRPPHLRFSDTTKRQGQRNAI
jgi:hypothetical protein